MIQPWKTIRSTPAGDFGIFTLRRDRRASPRGHHEQDYVILDCPDWVNVVALTPDGRLVMVEQYRHGSETVELEIPGGVMDPGENDPVAAGLRELREETGYAGTGARLLGVILPNPAFIRNKCHTVLVEQCEMKHPTAFDPGEDLATRLVPVAEIPRLLAGGQIQHSLVHVALCHFLLAQTGMKI